MYPNQELQERLTADQARASKLYPFEPGSFFLGLAYDQAGNPIDIGVKTKRHALTIAGARSGKGVGVIIPNLLRWPHNALVIDPKGEAAEATAEKREAMGQAVHVLDPFHVANVPERFRARFNPLQGLDPNGRTIREDINVLTDGLVMRHDPRAAHWDGGAASLISGVIAHVLAVAPPELQTLPEMRKLLTLPPGAFDSLIQEMATNGACGNLPASAAARLLRSGTEAGHFLSNADENTKWLDSGPIVDVLTNSTFDLADLKTKPTTVYLVLPAHLLNEHGRFLRLFVRAAIDAMAKGGTKDGQQTLFMLDEFFSLGRIDEIAKSSGLMPGYGVRLWPFLQDLSQLTSLYGDEAGTFFANADVHQFFGNADDKTLEYVSHRLGSTGIEEISPPPTAPVPSGSSLGQGLVGLTSNSRNFRTAGAIFGGLLASAESGVNSAEAADYQDRLNEYHRQMAQLGKPRVPPDQVAALVQLKTDTVADGAINFVYGAESYYLHLSPYFRTPKKNMNQFIKSILKKSLIWGTSIALASAIYSVFLLASALGLEKTAQYYSENISGVAILAKTFGLMLIISSLISFIIYSAISRIRFPMPRHWLGNVLLRSSLWAILGFYIPFGWNLFGSWIRLWSSAQSVEIPLSYWAGASSRGLIVGLAAGLVAFISYCTLFLVQKRSR